ncbi:roadblock/LC7 domain-containing protein [Streptomyces sp. NBC_00838]|uniref:roadblock/LC7 domain-containing protein n=1 Tax=Streptomyces sp. NBC_00838 TaxID=2903680 RepID=UPI00386C8D65|nr:roadblock/LC7 domain-containing protein [Streptomyces sp. NBC_00838]
MNSQLPPPNLGWILDDLVTVPCAKDAVLLSADGLLMATSKDVDRDLADTVSALSSGMQSLSHNAKVFSSGTEEDVWEQTMVQFGASFLFLVSTGKRSCLVVTAEREVNVQALSARIHKTITSLREALEQAPRHAAAGGA